MTDSGCIAPDDNPLVDGGEGIALGVGDRAGMLIDAEGTGKVRAVGLGCASPEAHAARLTAASVATIPKFTLRATNNLQGRWHMGQQPAIDATCEPDLRIRCWTARKDLPPNMERAEGHHDYSREHP